MSTPVVVGRVSKLFGQDGEVVINLYDTFPEEVNQEEPLLVRIDSLTVPLFLDKFQRRGRSGALVRFADFDTDVRVSELIGLELYLSSHDEDDDRGDEIYLDDFVGYTAILPQGLKGVVEGFVDSDHNPLFSVSVNGVEALIPASDDFIMEYDTTDKTITFVLPEGLLELYL